MIYPPHIRISWTPTAGVQGVGGFGTLTGTYAKWWYTEIENQVGFTCTLIGTATNVGGLPVTLTASLPWSTPVISGDWPASGTVYLPGRKAASAVISSSTLYVSAYDVTSTFSGAGSGFTVNGTIFLV